MIYKLINGMDGGPEKEIGSVSLEGTPDVVFYDGELYNVKYSYNTVTLVSYKYYERLIVFNEEASKIKI